VARFEEDDGGGIAVATGVAEQALRPLNGDREAAGIVEPAPPAGTAWQRSRPMRVDDFLEFTSGPKVRVQDGLNGVRGMAVIPVVAFHLGYYQVFGGAQLVMSLFFTQSGFLIATLILHEYERTGRLGLGPFWAARARRILPPAWITIAAVGVGRLTTKAFDIPNRMDMVTALLHVSNWYLYFSDAITDAIRVRRSSELNHTWSLSIEEQFYVFIAVLAIVLVVAVTRPLVWLRWIAIVGALVSFSLPFVFGMDDERVFYGTDTRAGEILTGVALATFMIYRSVRVQILRLQWWVVGASATALTTAVVLWHEATPKSRMLENGLLPCGSALWVLVVVGAMLPDGPVSWLMHGRLLRWLGKLSYGIYIYHFPILGFVRHFLDVHPIALSLIVVPATLVASVVSYRFVEMPIRRRQLTGRPLVLAATGVLSVIAITLALT
jgi:peptidoglycan/LPS O-acetylase OafA/YrhL